MIGIEFIYNINYTNIFKKILKNIDTSKYSWQIKEIDAIIENGISLNPDHIKDLLINDKYLTMFANIIVFPKDTTIEKIDTNEDFLKSKCELIILIYDVTEFEIYFKDNELKKQILQNIQDLKIKYTIKTKENDGRTKMSVQF